MKYLTLLTIIADGVFGDILKEILKILMYIPNLLFLVVDGIIYSVLAYAYKLFEIMARLNFMSIKTWFDPILENIKQLTIVVVMFAIGYALINYLINPDKINNGKIGGMALIKNIAIAGVLFIAVEVFFPLMNETTFLLIGAPEGYTYSSVLEQFGVSNDGGPGLIANVIYGKSSNEEQEDFGKILSLRTLNTFLHSKYGASVLDKVYKEAYEGKDFNLMGITAGFKDIEVFEEDGTKTGSIEYKYPVLSSIVGLFIIYILVTISIELGIRALKLIILEILAPIAIVTIIKDGWDAKVWKNWLSVYWKTYADVFLRVASMYMVVGLISKVFNNVSDLLSSSVKSGSFTTYIVMIIIVIAGFKLAKELPKFIDSILGSKLTENNKNGFGNFLKGIGTGLAATTGAAVGGIGGVAAGIAASKANGLSAPAAAWNAVKGGVSGTVAGSKGKKISDHIANINKNKEGLRTSAETMKDRGGTLRSNMAYNWREHTGQNYVGQKRTDAEIKEIQEQTNAENKTYEATMNGTGSVNSYGVVDRGIKGKIEDENKKYENTAKEIKSKIEDENRKYERTISKYDSAMQHNQSIIDTSQSNLQQWRSNRESFAKSMAESTSTTIASKNEEYQKYTNLAAQYRVEGNEEAAKINDAKAQRVYERVKKEAYDNTYNYVNSDVFETRNMQEISEAMTENGELLKGIETEKARHNSEIDRLSMEITTAAKTHEKSISELKTKQSEETKRHEEVIKSYDKQVKDLEKTKKNKYGGR